MGELSSGVLFYLLIFFLLPFLVGLIAAKLRLPTLIGYIVGGVVLSLFLRGTGPAFLPEFANIGIILLLFTVGLELDIGQLLRLRRFVLSAGLLQFFLTTLSLFVLAFFFRMDIGPALIISVAFSLSSTAIVAKLIQERGEEHSLLGSLAIGLLLFQDVAAIPLLIIFSSLTAQSSLAAGVSAVLMSLLKSALILVGLWLIGRRGVPFLFERMARRSRELLNLLTIVFIIAGVFIFSLLQLPVSVAAFLAGVLIGQTIEHYHIFSQIRPLRDLFAILFFVFLGTQVNFSAVFSQLPFIILFTLLVMLIKAVIIGVIFLAFKFHSRTAFSAGLLLSQVGEFAFLILYRGYSVGFISSQLYVAAVAAVLISIAVTPLLSNHKDRLYMLIKNFLKKRSPSFLSFLTSLDAEPAHLHGVEIDNHVIICGYGRLGSYIGRALFMARIPFVAIDYNVHAVHRFKKQGLEIMYGDPTDIDVLDYAQAEKARVLISAVPDQFSQEAIIVNARRLNPRMLIFSRVHQEGHQNRLKDLGAHTVVQPEFEAALSIIKKVLLNFNVPREHIVGKIKRLRLEHGMA